MDRKLREQIDNLHLKNVLDTKNKKRKQSCSSATKSILSSGTDISGEHKLTQTYLDKVNERRKVKGLNELFKNETSLHACNQTEARAIRLRSGSPKNLKLKYPSSQKLPFAPVAPTVTKYGLIHKDKIKISARKHDQSDISNSSQPNQSYNSVYKHHNRVSTIKTELTATLARLKTPVRQKSTLSSSNLRSKSNSKILAGSGSIMDDQFLGFSRHQKKVLKTKIATKKKKKAHPLESNKSWGKFEIILESPTQKDKPSYESLTKVIYDQRDLLEEKEKEMGQFAM